MRQARTLLVAAAAVISVSVAGSAAAQGTVRPRRPAPAGQPGSATGPGGVDRAPQGAPSRVGPNAAPGARAQAMMGAGPAAGLLRLRNQLSLTDDQVKRLEALQNATVPRLNPADALRARADLMDATRGDGDLAAARAAMDRMHSLRTDRAVARLKMQQDARAVLTADQKNKFDNLRAARGERLRMVAQARRSGATPRAMAPGARMRQPMRQPMRPQMGPGMPGMRPQVGPQRGGPVGPGAMTPRMRRGGEGSDSASLPGLQPGMGLGTDAQHPQH